MGSARAKVGVYLLFLSLYLLTAGGHFFSTDHVAVFLTTQSLVERHSLAIKPVNDTVPGQDGLYYSKYGLAQSILDIPLYLAGTLVERVGSPMLSRYFGGLSLGDWGGTPSIFFVSLGNQILTPLTCVLVFLFCMRLGYSERTSLCCTIVFGVCTGVWVYARDSFQHPLESLLLLACVYILFAHRACLRPRYCLLSGSALACGILTRFNLLIVLPAIAAYVLFLAPGDPSPGGVRSLGGLGAGRWRYLLAWCCPSFVALGCTLWLNQLRFGDILDFGYGQNDHGFSYPILAGLYGNLFSVGRSIFIYSPPVVLTLFTIGRFFREHMAEAVLFIVICVLYLLSYSAWWSWDGGWCWGPRFQIATLPFWIIPLGYAMRGGGGKVLLAVLGCLGAGVQVLGVTINYDFVYWDWTRMRLSPPNAYLFVPAVSPIATHFSDLLQTRHIDLWLGVVYQRFGLGIGLATLSVPLLLLASAVVLLAQTLRGECVPPIVP